MSPAEALRKELDRMVNAQFEPPEFRRFLSIRDERAYGSVVAGAQESLEIDRAYRLALAVAMEGIE